MRRKAEGIDAAAVAELTAIVGDRGVRDGTALAGLDPGMHDENFGAGLAVLPATTGEAAAVLALCQRRALPVVPQGGRSGLVGGSVSRRGEVIVMTDRLDRIELLDGEAGTAVVDAGVTLERLNREAAKQGLCLGVDLGARGTATIGGMISTNAGGNQAFRFGVMRQQVLGLEAVLADGSVLDDLTRVTKVTDGYDVKQLFIGAEGTLGLVTRAALRLLPRDETGLTALCACPGAAAAVAFFNRLRRDRRIELLSAEAMWGDYARETAALLSLPAIEAFARSEMLVLVELAEAGAAGEDVLQAVLLAAFDAGEADDALVAQSQGDRDAFWRIREDWALERAWPHGLWYDVSVPLSGLDAYVAGLKQKIAALDPALRIFLIGHLGDGNLHITVTRGAPFSEAERAAVSKAVYDGLRDAGGAISAEHGIGLDKRDSLRDQVSPGKFAVMRAIKKALDPKGIMIPGKVI